MSGPGSSIPWLEQLYALGRTENEGADLPLDLSRILGDVFVTTEQISRITWVEELYALSQIAADATDLDSALSRMLRHVVDAFAAESGTLALYFGDADELRIVAATDLPGEALGRSVRLGQGVLGRVARDGLPLLTQGALAETAAAAASAATEGAAARRIPASSLCWPLKIQQRLVGVFAVNRYDDLRSYEEQDLQRGSIMASMLALVIDNSRMHDDQQRRIQSLSRMNREMAEINARLTHAQAQLEQSGRMAAIGQLAAGVAHEINNPIGYVYSNVGTLEGYMERLLGRLTSSLGPVALEADPGLRELVEDVPALLAETREGLDRVRKIVQDLKDFSRGGEHDEWEWADLNAGLQSTLNIANNEIRYKGRLVRQLGPLPEVQCLPSQLNQVFLNLVVNAAHAIERGGEIRVSTAQEGDRVRIEVADDGCGIPEEIRDRIFEPFFTTKPVGQGTGLGLSLSYAIVRKHRGTIEVRSAPGAGTTFSIALPIAQPSPQGDEPHA
jgi:signal transduction histidine kinase